MKDVEGKEGVRRRRREKSDRGMWKTSEDGKRRRGSVMTSEGRGRIVEGRELTSDERNRRRRRERRRIEMEMEVEGREGIGER